ncbi:hypothetical protein [Neobacillus vireti]|uniref:hypothetical protein n=1 Tax=Neobacillus vireti TaxID=220686 RepID=UPI002FFEA91C
MLGFNPLDTNKRYIITGAVGFIGYYLSKKLLDLGCRVFGVDNITNIKNIRDNSGIFEYTINGRRWKRIKGGEPFINFKNILDGFNVHKDDGVPTSVEFKAAMDWCRDNGYIAYVPKGEYILQPIVQNGVNYNCWMVPDKAVVYFERGATLKLVADPKIESKLVYMGNNIRFYGELTLIGNSEIGPRYGEMQSNMFIYKKKDIYIERLISKQSWGDNLFIGGEITSKDTLSSNIKIDYFQGIDAKRKNLVFQDCTDVYIKTAYLDNARYGLNSLDVEPDNWENSNGLSCINTVEYMNVRGLGIDLTANTLSKTAKNYIVNINRLDVHVTQSSASVLLTYAITLNMESFSVTTDVNINRLIDTTYGSFISIKNLLINTDNINKLLRMSASFASNGLPEYPTVEFGQIDFRRGNVQYAGSLLDNSGGKLNINKLSVENHQDVVLRSNNTTGICTIEINELVTRNCGKTGAGLIIVDTVNATPYLSMSKINNYYAYENRTDVKLLSLIQFNEPETSVNFKLINLYNEKGTPVYYANSTINKTQMQTLAGSPGMPQIFSVVYNPEGFVTAKKGSLAICTDGNIYIKSVDGGNTGWVIK